MKQAIIQAVLAVGLASCASSYVPTQERYAEELKTILGHHEDNAIINYGEPSKVVELAEGWKILVYEKNPYSVSPLAETKKYAVCKTSFVVSPNSKIEKVRADGNYCVR